LKIALITADTYRIAAVEQLNTYAGILDVPVSVIFTPEELVEALNKYSDYDLILIDTAGRSHRNTEQVGELEQLLEVTEKAQLDLNIEKYLVMSATTKYKDLLNITDAYKDIKDFRLLFTKLDETNAYGNILNIRIHTGAPLSYITSGQAVPEDISVVDVQDLAKRLIIGEVKDSEN
jgi:flagellar biosynthesis protein FlhF